MKRNILFILVVFCIVAAQATTAQGQATNVKIIINGQEIQARGILGPERRLPMVPAEAVCQALDIQFSLNKIDNAVVAIKADSTLYAPIGRKDAIVSGEVVPLEEAATVRAGVAYIQASLLQSAFGLSVNWKEEEGILEVSSEAAPPPPAPAAAGKVRLLREIVAEKPGLRPVRVFVDGKELSGELAMEGERLLAPVSPLASALGCTVVIGSLAGSTVFALKATDGTTVDLTVDSDLAQVGNLPAEVADTSEPKEVKLPTPCRMVAGEIYVPVAGLVELVGASWLWKQEEKAVQVFTGKQPPPPAPSQAVAARLMSAILAEKPGLKPIRLTVDGVELEGELAMEEGRLLAPGAVLARELGWTTQIVATQVTLTGPSGASIRLEVGTSQGEIAAVGLAVHSFEVATPSRLLDAGILYVSLGGLVEAMGATQAWDSERKTAQVFARGVAPPEVVKPPKDAAGQASLVLEMGVEKPPRVTVEGKGLKAALAMEGGRLLAPVHVLASALGWEWGWRNAAEAPEGSVGVRRRPEEKWLYFAIGSDLAKDGQQKRMATPARFLRGMFYVPVADFAEVVGASWVWDKANKVVDIRPPVTPEAATKVGDILSNPAAYNGQLIFVVGRYGGREPANGGPAVSSGPPTSAQDWILENGTGAVYVAYDPAGDLNLAMEKGQEVAIWALVRLTADSRPYLEPGLAGGRWELVPRAEEGG